MKNELIKELHGSVEIDESLLENVSGGDHCHDDDDDGGGGPGPGLTTIATSCVPPGTQCP